MDYSAPKDTSVTPQYQDSCCPHLLHYAKPRWVIYEQPHTVATAEEKENCKSFNKSQWNKGPLWQPLLLLNICQNVITVKAEGPWLEPRVQKLQLVVTELERGEHDTLNQKPLESHGWVV